MTPEQIGQINALSTVVVAITAIIAIVLNVFLLAEQRATRNVAQVEAYPRLWGPNGMILALRLENYGPAAARAVELTYRLRDPDTRVVAEKRHGQAVLLAGGHVAFLPDSAIVDKLGGLTLNDLEERDLTLEAEWSWTDDRRRLIFWRAAHHGALSAAMKDLHRDFYGGWSLYEPTQQESLEAIAEDLRELRKLVKKQVDQNEKRELTAQVSRMKREEQENRL